MRVNPTTCVVTVLWQNASLPTSSGVPPAGVNFNSDYMDVTIDAKGDYYFITDLTHRLWQVKQGTTTAIYRGQLTGMPSGASISDIVFNGNNMYVTTAAGTSGIFLVNQSTLAATLVPGTASIAYSDAASSICSLLPLGVTIGGTVFHDANANTIINAGENFTTLPVPCGYRPDKRDATKSENFTTLPVPLYIYLVNSSNIVVDSSRVAENGTYSLDAGQSQNYTIELSTVQYPLGTNVNTTPIVNTPPTGWMTTGENLGNSGPGDGTPNGVLAVSTNVSDLTNANFGIQQLPDSDPVTFTLASQPLGGSSFTLNGIAGNPTLMSGLDTEDGTYTGNTGTVRNPQGVKITSLPTNGQLWYNGVQVTAAQLNNTIFANPALFNVVLIGSGYNTTSFGYAYVDAAGATDATPATYTIKWPTALPVSLLSFEASIQINTVALDWSTALEQNNKGFAIERSAEGKNWSNIGFHNSLAENGNSNDVLNYKFTDKAPLNGQNFYRLIQTDFDGKESLSPVRIVNFQSHNKIQVYPNPAQHTLFVEGLNGNETLRLIDVTGRIVLEIKNTATKASIDLSHVVDGVYHLHIKANGILKVKKVIKLKN